MFQHQKKFLPVIRTLGVKKLKSNKEFKPVQKHQQRQKWNFLTHVVKKSIQTMKTFFLVKLTKDNNLEEAKLKKDKKNFILNMEINANIENDITKWNNYGQIKKLSSFYQERQNVIRKDTDYNLKLDFFNVN